MDPELQQDNPAEEPSPQNDLNEASDAIAALMGDADDLPAHDEDAVAAETKEPKAEAKTEAKTETPEPEFEVTLDGAKVKVKQSELLNGYQRQAHATKKWQEAASLKAQAEQAIQTADQRAQQTYGQQLQGLMSQIESVVKTGQLAPPDPALLDSDPVAFLRQKTQWENAQQAYQTARQQTAQIQQQQTFQAEQQRLQTLATEREQLLAKFPDWKDETKMRAAQSELKTWLQSAGYKPEEMDITDHRAVLTAWKASQFDKLVAEQKNVVKNKVPPATPKAVKAGAASDEVRINQSAVQRLRRSGSTDDAAAAIASLMG